MQLAPDYLDPEPRLTALEPAQFVITLTNGRTSTTDAPDISGAYSAAQALATEQGGEIHSIERGVT